MSQTTAMAESSAGFNYGKWREGFLQAILVGASVSGFLSLAANYLTHSSTSDLITYSVVFAALLIATLIHFPYWVKAGVFLTLIFALSISGFLETGVWGDSRIFSIALVIMACLLFSSLAGIIVTAIETLTAILFGWLILTSQYQLTNHSVPMGSFADWLTATLTDILLAVVIIIGLRAIQMEFERAREQTDSALRETQKESKNLELRVEERTNQLSQKTELLRSSAYIIRNIAELQDVPSLLEKTVLWASELFGFYHVAIYLFDEEKRIAFLQAASSDDGKKMISSNFHVDSSPKSIIGYAAQQNKAYAVTDEPDGNKLRLTSEGQLESTHSRIALPLIVRGRTIGVLDFQSKEIRRFDQDDLEILQSLSDQIAISIESVHLLNDTQAFVGELESLTKQQTEVVWKEYLSDQAVAYRYTPAGTKAIKPDQVALDRKGIRIPLRLHGQDIGALTLQGKETGKWNERDQDIAQKVADQVALALDNSRLLEETRKRATQQQTVNEISARLSRSLDIDTLLQTAARELGSLPDVEEVSLVISTQDNDGQASK